MGRGCFISFEGIDGSGKGTQIRLLAEWLEQERGREVLLVREPGGTDLGERVRDLLLHGDDMSPSTEALLYASARAELVATRIAPALASGAVVVADRFVHSSIAYQGAGRGLGEERVRNANDLATGGTLPELVLLLRLDVAAAELRLAAAREETGETADRLEQAGRDFFQRVADSYDQLARDEADRFGVIDATRTVDEIQNAVRSLVGDTLDKVGA